MSEFSADQYFEGGNFTPAVADEMKAIMRRLRSWAAIARSNRGVLPLAADEADAILAALERAEKDREYLREKNEIIKAYAGPSGMTPEDVSAALNRAERVVSAARALYEHYGEDAEVVLGPELRAALASAPEGSDG